MTTFQALRNKHIQANRVRNVYQVRRVLKNGTLAKTFDPQLDALPTIERAIDRRNMLERLNPGSAYRVVYAGGDR